MERAPDWTPEEFETVLQSPGASDEEVARHLTTRTAGAVEVVREGIHVFHTGGDGPGILSAMARHRLSTGTPVTCPRCGERV